MIKQGLGFPSCCSLASDSGIISGASGSAANGFETKRKHQHYLVMRTGDNELCVGKSFLFLAILFFSPRCQSLSRNWESFGWNVQTRFKTWTVILFKIKIFLYFSHISSVSLTLGYDIYSPKKHNVITEWFILHTFSQHELRHKLKYALINKSNSKTDIFNHYRTFRLTATL